MKRRVCLVLVLMLVFAVAPMARADMASANEAAAQAAASLTDEQKRINVFTWTYYIPDEVIAEFEDATGITVNYSAFSSNEEMLGKMPSAQGQYDLMVVSDFAVQELIEQNMLTVIDENNLPDYANIDAAYQSQYYDPENMYSIPYTNTIPVIVYDPEQVDFEITGYADLWNPALRGKIAVVDELRVVVGMAEKTLGYSFNEADPAHLAEVAEKLTGLKDNIMMFNSDTPHNALISGDASVGVMYGSQIVAARQVLPQLQVVFPKEGITFGIDNLVIPAEAPHPEATYIFLNYLLDGEVSAQAHALINYGNCNTAAKDYETAEYQADETVNVPVDVLEGAEMTEVLDDETQAVYDEIWVNFKK